MAVFLMHKQLGAVYRYALMVLLVSVVDKAERVGIRADYYCPVYFLERERQDLYTRINERVDKMLKDGLEKEVRSLKRIRLSQTAKMALGLSHIKNCMDGSWSREEAVESLKRDTRRYAKRQLSWFRHEKGVVPVPVAPSDSPKKTASVILERWKKEMASG